MLVFLSKTLSLIARVLSDRTLNIVGPFYVLPMQVNVPTLVIYKCNLMWISPLFNIMVALATGELCAPPTVSGAA